MKEMGPVKLFAGVNVRTLLPPTVTVPPAGCCRIDTVSAPPSTSLSLVPTAIVFGAPSAMRNSSLTATGRSFTEVTPRVIGQDVWELGVSEILTVTVSGPK